LRIADAELIKCTVTDFPKPKLIIGAVVIFSFSTYLVSMNVLAAEFPSYAKPSETCFAEAYALMVLKFRSCANSVTEREKGLVGDLKVAAAAGGAQG
jgi:hypothetical protein